MKVLILIEAQPPDVVSAIETEVGTLCEPGTIEASIIVVDSTQEMIEEATAADATAIMITPASSNRALQAALAGLDCFTVEVQPENLAKQDRKPAGADAELYGFGARGYALALDLVRERT